MMKDSRRELQMLLASDDCHLTGSTFDPISARLAEQTGFRLGMFGGSAAALVILGAPDLSLVSLAEMAEQTRRICRASRIPVLVDADDGFGNALSVMRAVSELEGAGAAGLSIEDTEPQRFGSTAPSFISRDEAVGKLRAALAARKDGQFAVLARTNAMQVGDIPEAQARLRLFEALKPDGLFVAGVRRPEDLEAIAGVVELPLVIGDIPSELIRPEWLARLGVRVCIPGHQALSAAIVGLQQALAAQRAGNYAQAEALAAPPQLMAAVTRLHEYRDFAGRFLSAAETSGHRTERG